MAQQHLDDLITMSPAVIYTARATGHYGATFIRATADALVLSVRDDGRGIGDIGARGRRSFGILGMRESAIALGGTFQIRGRPEGGTTVTVTLPRGDAADRPQA